MIQFGWASCCVARKAALPSDGRSPAASQAQVLSFLLTGCHVVKPEVIIKLEQGEEPWIVEGGVLLQSYPGVSEEAVRRLVTWQCFSQEFLMVSNFRSDKDSYLHALALRFSLPQTAPSPTEPYACRACPCSAQPKTHIQSLPSFSLTLGPAGFCSIFSNPLP